MKIDFKKLKMDLIGSFWLIKEFEVEGLDVKDKWVDPKKDSPGSVTLEKFPCSEDNVLDIFISIVAPNRTVVKMNISGETMQGGVTKKIKFEEEYTVRNGKLKISISKPISELLNEELS